MGANRDSPYKGKSEGHVYRARRRGMDNPRSCDGPDKQVPPRSLSEGRARRARRTAMDYQTVMCGRDKRVPPSSGPDKQVSPWGKPEVVQSACPQKDS